MTNLLLKQLKSMTVAVTLVIISFLFTPQLPRSIALAVTTPTSPSPSATPSSGPSKAITPTKSPPLQSPATSTSAFKKSMSPTPVASASVAPSGSDSTQKLKERIDKVLGNNLQEAEKITTNGGSKRAIVGKITRFANNTFTLENNRGTQTITVDEDVDIVKESGKMKSGDISVGDWVAIMGYQNKDTFLPRRIAVSAKQLTSGKLEMKLVALESIKKPAKGSKNKLSTLMLVPRIGGENIELLANDRLTILDSNDTKLELKDIETEMQFLLVKSTQGGSDVYTLKSLALIKADIESEKKDKE